MQLRRGSVVRRAQQQAEEGPDEKSAGDHEDDEQAPLVHYQEMLQACSNTRLRPVLAGPGTAASAGAPAARARAARS